ncbi:MAG: hypothetical protein QOE41_1612 [Mycobacterium sp.]|jgi:hypothetical protein|nr:hypothetical protein [Mycobacterium sp.]MDT5132301.1 hypothetical protein [Mycobacterium sp.]
MRGPAANLVRMCRSLEVDRGGTSGLDARPTDDSPVHLTVDAALDAATEMLG